MKRTRLKTVWGFGVVIALLCGWAIYQNMEGVSTVLGGALGAIAAKYSHDETKRKSNA